MKDDFDMIERRFDGAVTIYPIADVHFGAINSQPEAWRAFCRMVAESENTYVVLNGDLINNNTRSSVGLPFDDTIRPREQKKAIVEFLAPIKDKILCLTSGNHERRSMKDADDDVTYDIACKLDIEDVYRPNAAFLKLGVGWRTHGKCARTSKQMYLLALTHGTGGGIYTGATVNRNERWGYLLDNVDCVIVGHTHKGTVTRPSKLHVDIQKNKIVSTDYLVISCVSWVRYSDYALQKMLPSFVPFKTAETAFARRHQGYRGDVVNMYNEYKCPICGNTMRVGYHFNIGATAMCDCGFILVIKQPRGAQSTTVGCIDKLFQVLEMIKDRSKKIECRIFDKEETYSNCTVQVLSNTVTGDVSIGWWKNDESEEKE